MSFYFSLLCRRELRLVRDNNHVIFVGFPWLLAFRRVRLWMDRT